MIGLYTNRYVSSSEPLASIDGKVVVARTSISGEFIPWVFILHF